MRTFTKLLRNTTLKVLKCWSKKNDAITVRLYGYTTMPMNIFSDTLSTRMLFTYRIEKLEITFRERKNEPKENEESIFLQHFLEFSS